MHSLTSKSNTHGPAENFLSTGFVLDGFPSLGSWVTYALGSENQNCQLTLPFPIHEVFHRMDPTIGAQVFASGFSRDDDELQGTDSASDSPWHLSRYRRRHPSTAQGVERSTLGEEPESKPVRRSIASYELAAKMQLSVPELTDLSSEPSYVLKAYGADDNKNPTKQHSLGTVS